MVEELDLTDHDVSVIASMIDDEIRSHVPDWNPTESSKANSGEEVRNWDNSASADKDDDSPLMNESAHSSSFWLERTNSGRKYWSNSPQAGGHSLVPLGHSNLCFVDSAIVGDDLCEETVQSPVSHSDGSTLEESENGPEGILAFDGGTSIDQENQASSQQCDTDNAPENLLGGREDNHTQAFETNGSQEASIIAEKLEHLLIKQQAELEDLRRKHEAAISGLLDGLSHETCELVLSICKEKIPWYKQ